MSEVVVDLCVLTRSSVEFHQDVALGKSDMGNTWHWPERVEE